MQPVIDPVLIQFRGEKSRNAIIVEMLRDGVPQPLALHLAVRNHSPMGFEWGYEGSGPAQLALAMCVEIVGPRAAEQVYQHVKDKLVAPISTKRWHMSGLQVMEAIEEHAPLAE